MVRLKSARDPLLRHQQVNISLTVKCKYAPVLHSLVDMRVAKCEPVVLVFSHRVGHNPLRQNDSQLNDHQSSEE